MRQTAILALAALGCLAAPALALSPATDPAAMDEVMVMDFTCAEDTGFTAIFLNTAGGNSYATMAFEGQPVWFEVAVSASGARYVSQPVAAEDGDEVGIQLELWTKGKTATLSVLDGDSPTPLFTECSAE